MLMLVGADFPGAIKLVAGCMQHLQQAAQLQPDFASEDMCHCKHCQVLQTLFGDPRKDHCSIVVSPKEARHVIT